jgi:hypothetical protein
MANQPEAFPPAKFEGDIFNGEEFAGALQQWLLCGFFLRGR